MNVSELRIVKVKYHKEGKPTDHVAVYYMHESQVSRFLAAQVDLHHVRGNKHNGVQCNNLWEVRCGRLTEPTRWWWCSANQEPNDPEGAEIFRDWDEEVIWQHPGLVKAIAADQAMEEREEYEAELR